VVGRNGWKTSSTDIFKSKGRNKKVEIKSKNLHCGMAALVASVPQLLVITF
jgi:hypothetical protein